MLNRTTKLFIKALIIGLLVNLGLQQFPVSSTLLTEERLEQEDRQPLKSFPGEDSSGLFKKTQD